MSYVDALRHHLERCLRRDLELGPLQPDSDGNYPVVIDQGVVWVVPMLADEPALVRVWSAAAYGVKSSKALLADLNEVNVGLRQVRCLLDGEAVLIAAETEVERIAAGELGRLVRHVGATARHVGELITAVYGGQLPPNPSMREDVGAGE